VQLHLGADAGFTDAKTRALEQLEDHGPFASLYARHSFASWQALRRGVPCFGDSAPGLSATREVRWRPAPWSGLEIPRFGGQFSKLRLAET
jgi:hypothetical protein